MCRCQLLLLIAMLICGCAKSRPHVARPVQPPVCRLSGTKDDHEFRIRQVSAEKPVTPVSSQTSVVDTDASTDSPLTNGIIQAAAQLSQTNSEQPADQPALPVTGDSKLQLDEVIASVYRSYPSLVAAIYSRNIAAGEQLSAQGAFDFKIKAASENGPTGFYQTYRQAVGVVQPTYWGGEVFGGYRIGRGDYQPWYLERQTNDGGEFKAGLQVPLARNLDIDERRAALWRSGWERQLVEPEIQAQLIDFVQQAGYAYWEWVAAGAKYRLAQQVLAYANDRTERIRDQVNEGLIDPPELTDNLRLVSERRAFLAQADRKLQQSAVKLSLYWRDASGNPIVPDPSWLPGFPEPWLVEHDQLSTDTAVALQSRPELPVFDFMRRKLEVDYAAAENELLPELNALVWGSQDVGAPTSPKRDKSEFELEAALLFELPLQRRKARGKMASIEGKLAQLQAKRRLAEDRIVTDVQSAYAALTTAYQEVLETRQAVQYANELADRERLNQEEGISDLLKVTLREQYAAEAASKQIDALQKYFQAQSDYRAALGQDALSTQPAADPTSSP